MIIHIVNTLKKIRRIRKHKKTFLLKNKQKHKNVSTTMNYVTAFRVLLIVKWRFLQFRLI